MDGNSFDRDGVQDAPVSYEPPVPQANTSGGRNVLKVVLSLAVFSFLSLVLLLGAFVVAARVGVFDSGDPGVGLSPEPEPDSTTAPVSEVENVEDAIEDLPAPIVAEDVSIAWDSSPSDCDENNNRSFFARVENGTSESLGLTIRLLDSGQNWVHESHTQTVAPETDGLVELGGILSGEWIVQLIDVGTNDAISQTTMTFDSCG